MEIIPNKYILIFEDNNDYIDYYLKIIKDTYQLNIVKFLLNNEIKTYNDTILEIYPDQYTEDIIVKNSLLVIYFSNIIRSTNLIHILEESNKFIIFKRDDLEHVLPYFLNHINKNILIEDSIKNFKIYIQNLSNIKINKLNKNIKLEYTKINKIYENKKLHMIIYFKNVPNNKILNILQKKGIIENSKNKYIKSILVIGYKLNEEFNESDISSNIILYNLDENTIHISFKKIFEIAHKYFQNQIICIIRSDNVLINQINLENIELDILSSENNIYCLSRIEYLINCTYSRPDKDLKVFNSCEQDAWILKLPLNIDINKLENIYIYDKYSELYLNYILKMNGYNLINDMQKYKILRLMCDNNINNRLLINEAKIQEDNIYLLPDFNTMQQISIEQLIHSFNLNSDQMYELKCELFNKYLKNKIYKNL